MAVVAWIDPADVRQALGHVPATADDVAWLERATAAANEFAYRRRRTAGYTDDPATVPSDDVHVGTVLYAAALYKERGAVESFATFDQGPGPIVTGNWPRIRQLLGIDRPGVA